MSTNNTVDNIDTLIYNESILSGKMHDSLEDPVSHFFYDISDIISPYLCKLGITPNQITTVRFILIIGVFTYCFKNKMYNCAAMSYIVAYFMDCLDGHMARKYNMGTEFGDYYDHIADIISEFLVLYYILNDLNDEFKWVMIIILLSLVISLVQNACEERYLQYMDIDTYSKSLSPISCLCPESLVSDDDLESFMEYSRLFGVGVYKLFVTILIWNFRHLS